MHSEKKDLKEVHPRLGYRDKNNDEVWEHEYNEQ